MRVWAIRSGCFNDKKHDPLHARRVICVQICFPHNFAKADSVISGRGQPHTMRRRAVTFVTGNANKLRETQRIVGGAVPMVSRKVDLDELQGEPEEVSRRKCRLAAEVVGGPTVVEDTSLCFNALGGLPGVYIKWFLDKTGHAGLNNLLAAYDDKTAYAQCIFAYSRGPGAEPVLFVGRCPGRVVPARGPNAFGWDPVFEPDEGGGLTFAEMDAERKNAISHRSRALAELKRWFAEHPDELEGGGGDDES